tara:strand:+ start:352 stop:606 length:255 start_codon:yes stop_codon:yes gene_type:complete
MKVKQKGTNRRSNPPPPYSFYPNASMRGKMKTNDGIAIWFFAVAMAFFMFFSILSVINSDSKSGGKNDSGKIQEIKKRIFEIIK